MGTSDNGVTSRYILKKCVCQKLIDSGAPFELNQFGWTLLAVIRWVGSPITSLTATLWNIKLTGKCTLLLDQASSYGSVPPDGSPFSNLRNSMMILFIMNPYLLPPMIQSSDAVLGEAGAIGSIRTAGHSRSQRVALCIHHSCADLGAL